MIRGPTSMVAVLSLWLVWASQAAAQPEEPVAPDDQPPEEAEAEAEAEIETEADVEPAEIPDEDVVEDDLALELEPVEPPSDFESRLYGYIDSQWRRPIGEGEDVHAEGGLAESSEEHIEGFDLLANIMLQGTIMQRYRFFVNLAAPRAGNIANDRAIALRNAWVEAPLYGDLLVIRAGKTYRRFGLYNEILDARPTFMGIEPPEILVQGHLLLTRTTNLMIHGSYAAEDHNITYALMTGGDESAENTYPIGVDVHYDFGDIFRIGTSFYWTGGDAVPTAPFGDEGPIQNSNGGVMPWMARDEYIVYGAYAQLTYEGLTIQAEYWRSPHEATRDVDSLLYIARNGRLNDRQRQRFYGDSLFPTEGDVNTTADYTVRTFWARLGYEILLGDFGALTPYVHFDYVNHPEAIADESLGGNEAGIADDGRFVRLAGGFVYRPIAPVAFKAELNPHFAKVRGETQVNNELRLSLSYYWELW